MIYICEDCHFLFWSDIEIEQCPDCGKLAVRPADEEEQAEYWSYQREFHPERLAAIPLPLAEKQTRKVQDSKW